MPVRDIYSKRQKRLSGDAHDFFSYDDIPTKFRTQLVHIITDCLGEVSSSYYSSELEAYKAICDALHREYGVFNLNKEPMRVDLELFKFIMTTDHTDNLLDAIEVSIEIIKVYNLKSTYRKTMGNIKINKDEAISELNTRFLENAIGYQYESGQIIRIDSKFIHSDIMKPTLSVLSSSEYEGANDEFLSAHEHYRNGNYKECLIDCLKSFESTMKIICTKNQWEFNSEKDTATKLIEICFQNKLIPDYLQSQFGTLQSNLESGISTVRNREAGHGQGAKQKIPPPYLVSYLLHLTATSILLLTDAEKELP